MALTYQPFAESPEIEDINRDLRMNLPDSERLTGGALALVLAAAGLVFRGFTRWSLLGLAGTLIARSLSGKCQLYRMLGVDRRHPRSNKGANQHNHPSDEEISTVAHRLWSEEGEPEGKAEEHWTKATEQLRQKT
jgi:hypothetical protein